MSEPPSAANGYDLAYATLLIVSYRHWTGRDLVVPTLDRVAAARALYEAPAVVLAHDACADPRFTYANLAAQRLFEMSWEKIVGLPSRYSAEPLARAARARVLAAVAARGYVDDYAGVRVSASGRRFRIERATVWNLLDAGGAAVGQAATFSAWRDLAPTSVMR